MTNYTVSRRQQTGKAGTPILHLSSLPLFFLLKYAPVKKPMVFMGRQPSRRSVSSHVICLTYKMEGRREGGRGEGGLICIAPQEEDGVDKGHTASKQTDKRRKWREGWGSRVRMHCEQGIAGPSDNHATKFEPLPQQAKTRHARLEKEGRGHGLLVVDAARTLAEVLGLPKLVALPGPPAATVAGTLVSSEASMVACWRGCVVGCCGAET